MELYVYRHAMMGSRGNSDKEDPGLSEIGKEQVAGLQTLARALNINPKIILASPLRRAKETAELARELFWGKSKIMESGALLPEADLKELYSELNNLGGPKQVVLVTHYPLIKELVSDMLGFEFKSELLNGSLMRVDFQEKVSSSKGSLISIITPSAP